MDPQLSTGNFQLVMGEISLKPVSIHVPLTAESVDGRQPDGILHFAVQVQMRSLRFKSDQKNSGHAVLVKRKPHQRNQPASKETKVPAAVGQPPPRQDQAYITRQWLDEVAAGTEKSIRNTPAFKDAVRRLGLKEVRRRLRFGCLTSQYNTAANPLN